MCMTYILCMYTLRDYGWNTLCIFRYHPVKYVKEILTTDSYNY